MEVVSSLPNCSTSIVDWIEAFLDPRGRASIVEWLVAQGFTFHSTINRRMRRDVVACQAYWSSPPSSSSSSKYRSASDERLCGLHSIGDFRKDDRPKEDGRRNRIYVVRLHRSVFERVIRCLLWGEHRSEVWIGGGDDDDDGDDGPRSSWSQFISQLDRSSLTSLSINDFQKAYDNVIPECLVDAVMASTPELWRYDRVDTWGYPMLSLRRLWGCYNRDAPHISGFEGSSSSSSPMPMPAVDGDDTLSSAASSSSPSSSPSYRTFTDTRRESRKRSRDSASTTDHHVRKKNKRATDTSRRRRWNRLRYRSIDLSVETGASIHSNLSMCYTSSEFQIERPSPNCFALSKACWLWICRTIVLRRRRRRSSDDDKRSDRRQPTTLRQSDFDLALQVYRIVRHSNHLLQDHRALLSRHPEFQGGDGRFQVDPQSDVASMVGRVNQALRLALILYSSRVSLDLSWIRRRHQRRSSATVDAWQLASLIDVFRSMPVEAVYYIIGRHRYSDHGRERAYLVPIDKGRRRRRRRESGSSSGAPLCRVETARPFSDESISYMDRSIVDSILAHHPTSMVRDWQRRVRISFSTHVIHHGNYHKHQKAESVLGVNMSIDTIDMSRTRSRWHTELRVFDDLFVLIYMACNSPRVAVDADASSSSSSSDATAPTYQTVENCSGLPSRIEIGQLAPIGWNRRTNCVYIEVPLVVYHRLIMAGAVQLMHQPRWEVLLPLTCDSILQHPILATNLLSRNRYAIRSSMVCLRSMIATTHSSHVHPSSGHLPSPSDPLVDFYLNLAPLLARFTRDSLWRHFVGAYRIYEDLWIRGRRDEAYIYSRRPDVVAPVDDDDLIFESAQDSRIFRSMADRRSEPVSRNRESSMVVGFTATACNIYTALLAFIDIQAPAHFIHRVTLQQIYRWFEPIERKMQYRLIWMLVHLMWTSYVDLDVQSSDSDDDDDDFGDDDDDDGDDSLTIQGFIRIPSTLRGYRTCHYADRQGRFEAKYYPPHLLLYQLALCQDVDDRLARSIFLNIRTWGRLSLPTKRTTCLGRQKLEVSTLLDRSAAHSTRYRDVFASTSSSSSSPPPAKTSTTRERNPIEALVNTLLVCESLSLVPFKVTPSELVSSVEEFKSWTPPPPPPPISHFVVEPLAPNAPQLTPVAKIDRQRRQLMKRKDVPPVYQSPYRGCVRLDSVARQAICTGDDVETWGASRTSLPLATDSQSPTGFLTGHQVLPLFKSTLNFCFRHPPSASTTTDGQDVPIATGVVQACGSLHRDRVSYLPPYLGFGWDLIISTIESHPLERVDCQVSETSQWIRDIFGSDVLTNSIQAKVDRIVQSRPPGFWEQPRSTTPTTTTGPSSLLTRSTPNLSTVDPHRQPRRHRRPL